MQLVLDIDRQKIDRDKLAKVPVADLTDVVDLPDDEVALPNEPA